MLTYIQFEDCMATRRSLKLSKKLVEVKHVTLFDQAEVPTPSDFLFGSVSCQREYADVFIQLFQNPFRPKDHLK